MLFSRREALSTILGLGAVVASSCTSSSSGAAPILADGPVVRGISYVGISVSDIDKTTAYFAAGAGLVEVDRSVLRAGVLDRIAGKNVEAQTRTLRSNSGQIRLMQFAQPAPAARSAGIVPVQGPGITHVCFQSPDEKPIFPKFVAAGARPLSRTGDWCN